MFRVELRSSQMFRNWVRRRNQQYRLRQSRKQERKGWYSESWERSVLGQLSPALPRGLMCWQWKCNCIDMITLNRRKESSLTFQYPNSYNTLLFPSLHPRSFSSLLSSLCLVTSLKYLEVHFWIIIYGNLIIYILVFAFEGFQSQSLVAKENLIMLDLRKAFSGIR